MPQQAILGPASTLVNHALSLWRPATPRQGLAGDAMRGRMADAIAAEEQAGLRFAFAARAVAVLVVALWLPYVVPAPRVYYYLAFVAAFFVLGLVPHLLRRHRHARPIKLGFTLLDVILITVVVIVPPPGELAIDWPVQMRIRFAEYLYLLLLIVGAALSYSPLAVLWTGLCVIVVWSTGVLILYNLPDTLRVAAADPLPADLALDAVLSPTFVSTSVLSNQIVLTAIATGLLAAAVARSRRMLLRHTSAEVARADLARYVSPDVVDAMITSKREFGEPTARDVAVLFADIVGFTALSERLPPDRMVTLLTSFHSRICRVVFRNGGTLDKYLGDGFMAVFGTLADDPDAPDRAVRCALELQAEMDRWNAKRMARGAFVIPLGIGIHAGRVVVGNVGADARREFTVIGDTVNVASRLERLTRERGCRIAVSETCLAALPAGNGAGPQFDPIGPVQLPGRAQPIAVLVWPTHPTAAEKKVG
jgi:adenylate cyclase